jgi:hypothetical protein
MMPARLAFAAAATILTMALAGCDRRVAERPSMPASAQPVLAVSTGVTPIDLGRNPSVGEIATSYTHLTRITKNPVPVDPQFSYACAPAVRPSWEEAQRVHGPHAETTVTIYMNPPAAQAFAGRPSKPYPVGAVIVKEKQANSGRAHDGVGGMVKRSPGYDPAHGDWEYFYFRDPGQIESGRIATCVQCHSGASKKGYVFGDWASTWGAQ